MKKAACQTPHKGCKEVHPSWNQSSTEQQNSEKSGFQEERHQAFIGHHGREHVGSCIGKPTPARTELKRHDNAGSDAHRERDRKTF
jgi:hypothetical protein